MIRHMDNLPLKTTWGWPKSIDHQNGVNKNSSNIIKLLALYIL